MTTARQVKKMVKPRLARHSDLALVERWIYVKPIQHFARAVLIDRTSSADQFSPRWVVVHLFEARSFFPLNFGSHLSNPRQGLWWSAKNDANVADALVQAIEEQALPWLRTMSSLDLYLSFVSMNYFRHHLFDKAESEIIAHVACGYLEAARKICDKHLESWSVDNPRHDEDDKAKYRRLRELCALLIADDRV
jgi:hypothetical protein